MTELETHPAEGATIDWQARAVAYELSAFSFRYPGPELVEALVSGEWAEAADEVVVALGLVLPEAWGEGLGTYENRDADDALHALRAEATRLFVGAPEPAVSPYEGIWRAADDGVQALLFVNPHSMAVERFMRSCGVGRPEGKNEPLDRADIELELLQYLCMIEVGLIEAPAGVEPLSAELADEDGIGAADGVDSPDAPRATWALVYRRFLEEHVLAWLPRFADAVAAETHEPFYRTAAQLLKAVIDLPR